MEQTFDIVMEQLVADEEFRRAFIRSPRATLRHADDWGLALSDSERYALLTSGPQVFERLADGLGDRLRQVGAQ
jgi:hypothetical protein